MKIAINRCFGGFVLSPYAEQRYAELTGRECYFFKQDYNKTYVDAPHEYTPIAIEEASGILFYVCLDIPNPMEIFSKKLWRDMTRDEQIEQNSLYDKHVIRLGNLKRNDPLLIQIIEELGEQANGSCAELKIVEIPNDVNWEINDYDGMESVRETSREWW